VYCCDDDAAPGWDLKKSVRPDVAYFVLSARGARDPGLNPRIALWNLSGRIGVSLIDAV
jgi:hypothetical protein